MSAFILRRLALLVPTLVGISLLVFLMIYLVPGDPAQIMLGERANAESVAALRQQMGLDQPFYVQFGRFFWDLLRLDLGRSIRTHEKIVTEILHRFPATCELTVVSMGLAIVGGVFLGVLAAVRRGRMADFLGMVLATAGISVPVFWLGLMLMLLLSVQFPLFPVSGRVDAQTYLEPITHFYLLDAALRGNGHAFGDAAWHLVLPAVTLGTIPLAVIARMTRSSLLEVLGEDYVRTAWAKGLSERLVVLRHALKNSFVPTLTVIALQFGYLLGGAIITETIFAWPGLGRWLFLAVLARDFRAVQGGVLLLSTVFVLMNLLADVLYAWLDPRIRYD
ncbi:MAG: peptide ABC transporter permease [Gemmatimonadetes bacterium]|jgi:peptide/nickel transport system permease protein|nr:peptide ABC transporter permease [Gemmatimonadota bacterium]MEC7842025.1 ABC transporter permease [Candidatus Latescibacterota bacterium]